MDSDILLHILTGEATYDEKKKFYSQLNENKEEEELFYQIKSLWLKSSMSQTTVDADAEFKILWKRIKNPEKPERQTSFSIWSRILSYAAIVLLIVNLDVSIGYLIFRNMKKNVDTEVQKYTAMKGSIGLVELSDGTKIWLNSGSELTYREDSKKKQRLSTLRGEAYFEIAHNEDFPFMVEAGKLIIRDLGTTFNIKAYPEDGYIEAELVEGKADILTAGGKKLLSLNPGESAIYCQEKDKIELRPDTGNILSGWREGKFVMRDQRLEDIFNELSKWYDVEFRFENKEVCDYRFTGSIKKSTTISQVLKMLKMTTDFNYRITENGTIPERIIIY